MFACPHCNARSISAWRKFGATDPFPTRCPACGGLSFVSAWAHFTGAFVMEALLWSSAIAAVLASSWMLLLLFPLGVLAWAGVVGAAFPLRPIEQREAARARRKTVLCFAGGVLLLTALWAASAWAIMPHGPGA